MISSSECSEVRAGLPHETTLLDILHLLSKECSSERELVARARALVLGGRVRLVGAFGFRVVKPT